MSLMQSQIGPVIVKVFSGLEPEGEEYRGCRITFLGSNPVTARAWKMLEGRWVDVDTLVNATVIEQGKFLTITGTSKALVNEVGLTPSNAQVRWEVENLGCTNCN